MKDNDLIRRGDVHDAVRNTVSMSDALDAIAALPAFARVVDLDPTNYAPIPTPTLPAAAPVVLSDRDNILAKALWAQSHNKWWDNWERSSPEVRQSFIDGAARILSALAPAQPAPDAPAKPAALDVDAVAALVEAAEEASLDLGAWVDHGDALRNDGFDVDFTATVKTRLDTAIARIKGAAK